MQITINKLIRNDKHKDAEQSLMKESANDNKCKVDDYLHEEMGTGDILKPSTARNVMLIVDDLTFKHKTNQP